MNHIEMLLDKIEAVIFDVDGTLIDSMGVWREVDEIYLARYNKEMPDNLQKDLSGLSIKQAADYFKNVIGIDETQEKMLADWNELAMHQYRHEIMLKESAAKWLATIAERGLPMAVGTSNTRMLAHAALEVHQIEHYFKVIMTGEDVVKGKPDPYIYQTAAARLGVKPENCLVFEDIPAGIMAGRSAGMKVCAVWDSFSEYQTDEKKALANYYIHSFEDIYTNKVEVLR
jgi:16S rRNA pseudouridine516 synthase